MPEIDPRVIDRGSVVILTEDFNHYLIGVLEETYQVVRMKKEISLVFMKGKKRKGVQSYAAWPILSKTIIGI